MKNKVVSTSLVLIIITLSLHIFLSIYNLTVQQSTPYDYPNGILKTLDQKVVFDDGMVYVQGTAYANDELQLYIRPHNVMQIRRVGTDNSRMDSEIVDEWIIWFSCDSFILASARKGSEIYNFGQLIIIKHMK